MKKIDYSYSGEVPEPLQKIGNAYQVNFDTVKCDIQNMDGQQPIVQYKSLYARVPGLDYGMLVSAIIGTRYSTSDAEAIMLNYRLVLDADPGISTAKIEEYKKEYQSLQSWRLHSKEVAKTCLP